MTVKIEKTKLQKLTRETSAFLSYWLPDRGKFRHLAKISSLFADEKSYLF